MREPPAVATPADAPAPVDPPRERARPERPAARPPAVESEPRYYAAHELDVFPRLAAPIPFDFPAADGGIVTGSFRFEVMIDASGAVTRITAPDGGEADAAASAARAWWRRARFEPALRGGVAVASRIEIEVKYAASAARR